MFLKIQNVCRNSTETTEHVIEKRSLSKFKDVLQELQNFSARATKWPENFFNFVTKLVVKRIVPSLAFFCNSHLFVIIQKATATDVTIKAVVSDRAANRSIWR